MWTALLSQDIMHGSSSLYTWFFLNCSHLLKKKLGYSTERPNGRFCVILCIWSLKLNNKLRKTTQYDTHYVALDVAQPWNHLWSALRPIGIKRRADYTFLWRCNNDLIKLVTILSTVLKCERQSWISMQQLYCRRDALMWSRFERVKERRRGTAESNDWFNLINILKSCGDE